MGAGSRALFRAALSRGRQRSVRVAALLRDTEVSSSEGVPRCTAGYSSSTSGSQLQPRSTVPPCLSLIPHHSAAAARMGQSRVVPTNARVAAGGVRSFAASSGNLPDHVILEMPSLSPTMTQGNVVEWNKKEGDEVSAGDSLCVIETDKATLDNESQEDGFLAKILVPGGSKEVPCGTPICIMVDSADAVSKFSDYSSPEASTAPASSADQPEAPSSPASEAIAAGTGGQRGGEAPKAAAAKTKAAPTPQPAKASPPPPAASKPTPPPTGAVAPSSEGSFVDLPNSQIRKVIASRLLESKWQTPHFYSSAEAHVDALLALRKSLKEKYSISVSVNDFVVKAVAMALKEVPRANAFYDVAAGDIKMNGSVDVCVAVATDRGLMTPIVKNADKKSLSDLSSEVKALAERARAGKLKPEEFMGGTFSISNLGMFPVDNFCAIINPPQAGILAIGRGNKVVVWKDDPAGGVGGPATVTSMEVTLSGDARVMDGTVAGLFLTAVTKNLTDPTRLII